jgi:rSAM/selenodomain-associated transferase 1
MAKWPVPGQVKTRLSPPLSPRAAAELYAAFVTDIAQELDPVVAEKFILVAGAPAGLDLDRPDAPAALAAALPARWPAWPAWPVRSQRGEDLGQRLGAAFADLGLDRRPVVLVGADHPDLPRAEVESALGLLPGADLVLGPTLDGGYYLIGLARPTPEILTDMPWSSPRLLRATLDRASALGLSSVSTRPWYDVDRPADLEFLEQHVRLLALAGEERLAATAAVLGAFTR